MLKLNLENCFFSFFTKLVDDINKKSAEFYFNREKLAAAGTLS
jgi:hypothetical protein